MRRRNRNRLLGRHPVTGVALPLAAVARVSVPRRLFDGAFLDRGAWNVEVNCDGSGNHELQCYVDSIDNIFLRDGMLHITARKESDGSVTSGRLTTQGKVEIAYGRWEARLKVPGVMGTWPAFWTLGNDINPHHGSGEGFRSAVGSYLSF